MSKSPTKKQLLKTLNSQLKKLKDEHITAKKIEGIDDYITVKLKKSQAHFKRVKKKGVEDKAVGEFFLLLDITAKKDTVYIPVSIASSKKPTGFMYQIEGTAEGAISTAEVKSKGEGVMQITLGTLVYSEIQKGRTASFRIQVHIKGKFGNTYKIALNRINYKLNLTDVRYLQYLKETATDSVNFS